MMKGERGYWAKKVKVRSYGTKYSKMEQIKFVEGSL